MTGRWPRAPRRSWTPAGTREEDQELLSPSGEQKHQEEKKPNQRELADLKVEPRHLGVRDPDLQPGTVLVALQIRRQPVALQLHCRILAVVDVLHTSTQKKDSVSLQDASKRSSSAGSRKANAKSFNAVDWTLLLPKVSSSSPPSSLYADDATFCFVIALALAGRLSKRFLRKREY